MNPATTAPLFIVAGALLGAALTLAVLRNDRKNS